MAQTIWFSAAFTAILIFLLALTIADHYRILTLPEGLRPYCGADACDYGELIQTLLFMIAGGAALHLACRLVRHLFDRFV